MSSVIFGFSKPVNFNLLSAAIEAVEKRPFSHCYVRFKEPVSQKDVVFQASGLVVNMCLFETFRTEHIPVEEFELPVTDSEFAALWNEVLSELGVSYSVLQLIYILINKLVRTKTGDAPGEICSKLAAQVSTILGLPVSGDLSYETPSDFEKFCSQHMQRVL